jgi:hypothetical protein
VKRRRPTQQPDKWADWVAGNMQQHERGLSPFDDSRPSALILIPLLGLPALLVIGLVVAFVLR